MEAAQGTLWGSIWRRKWGYQRVNQSSRRRRIRRIRLWPASSSGRWKRRFSWGIRVKPRVKFAVLLKPLSWPKKLLVWLRDAYVNMMLRVANSPAMATGYSVYGLSMQGSGPAGFGRTSLREYDEKMILEIYRSLVIAQGKQPVISSLDVPRPPPLGPVLEPISE